MDKKKIKTVLSDEKGITLTVLILIIIVTFILAGVAIQSGTESLDSTRLKGFYMQLEIIQKRVDDIAATNESYKDAGGNTVYLKDKGVQVTTQQIEFLSDVLIGLSEDDAKNFRYFTIEALENDLDLLHMEYNVFINFEDRIVVAEEGIIADGVQYYVLENTNYFVEQNEDKNVQTIQNLSYQVTAYGTDKYKVVISPENYNIGDLTENGYVRYKKTDTKYWETSDNTQIILEFGIEYNIVYIDSNSNTSGEKKIKVDYKKDEEGNFIKDDNGNNVLTVTEVTIEESEEN